MQEEKLKQLKVVFKKLLGTYLNVIGEWNLDNLVEKLLYEVKIRINNK